MLSYHGAMEFAGLISFRPELNHIEECDPWRNRMFHKLTIVLLTMLILVSSREVLAEVVLAQDDSPSNPQTDEWPDYQHLGVVVTEDSSGAKFYEPFDFADTRFRRPGFNLNDRQLTLLSKGRVREALGLTKTQEARVADAFSRSQKLVEAICIESSTNNTNIPVSEFQKLHEPLTKAIAEVLAEEQKERLLQVTARDMLNETELRELPKSSIWRQLGIRLEQQEAAAFKERFEEIEREYAEAVAAAKENAIQQTFDALPPEQRDKALKFFGDPLPEANKGK